MDETALASVGAILWQEREQLERLLFSLVSQQLVLTSGRSRWLAHCDTQVQGAVATIRDTEVLRSIEVGALARTLGIRSSCSLAELADASPEPWSDTFRDHRTALRALAAEVDGTVAENRRLLQAGSQAIQETLGRIGSFTSTYDSRGGSVRRGSDPSFLDEQA